MIDIRSDVKSTKALADLLRSFALGLNRNTGIDPPTMLIFIHQILTEHVERLFNGGRISTINGQDVDDENTMIRTDSCLILPVEPTRIGAKPKTSRKSKVHMFVEFGLHLLGLLLKANRFNDDDAGRYVVVVALVI